MDENTYIHLRAQLLVMENPDNGLNITAGKGKKAKVLESVILDHSRRLVYARMVAEDQTSYTGDWRAYPTESEQGSDYLAHFVNAGLVSPAQLERLK